MVPAAMTNMVEKSLVGRARKVKKAAKWSAASAMRQSTATFLAQK
jgi:hypothetical protein